MKFSKYLIIMMQMLWRQLAPFSFPGNTEGKIEWHNQDGNPQQLFPVGGDDVWGTKENFYTTDPSSLSWNTFQQLLTIQQICLPVIHKDSLWAGYFGGKKKMFYPRWFSKHAYQLHFTMDRVEDQKMNETEDLLCTLSSLRKSVL